MTVGRTRRCGERCDMRRRQSGGDTWHSKTNRNSGTGGHAGAGATAARAGRRRPERHARAAQDGSFVTDEKKPLSTGTLIMAGLPAGVRRGDVPDVHPQRRRRRRPDRRGRRRRRRRSPSSSATTRQRRQDEGPAGEHREGRRAVPRPARARSRSRSRTSRPTRSAFDGEAERERAATRTSTTSPPSGGEPQRRRR